MSRFSYIETEKGGEVVHTFHNVSAICPIEDFSDNYTITLRYRADGYVAEISSLRNWLDHIFRNEEITHLDLAHRLLEAFIDEMPGYEEPYVHVETNRYRGTDTEIHLFEDDLNNE